MIGSGTVTFNDPQQYRAAVRPAQGEMLVTAKGDFRANLTRTQMPQLWMQSGRENLPRVLHVAVDAERPPIYFLADAKQAPIRHNGMGLSFGEIIVTAPGSTHHLLTEAPSHWAALSLTQEDLTAAGHTLAGRELTVPSVSHRLRPSLLSMSRLQYLCEAAGRLASAAGGSPTPSEPNQALEQALIHVMITCMTDAATVEKSPTARQHSAIIERFEELLARNRNRPLYLAEICAATGASERTLRVCCHEHLGMGPVRYLWLRRMHLARRALIIATEQTAGVTEIAMDPGFWELGRFAVNYRALFRESPSASLRRQLDDRQISRGRPLAKLRSKSA